MGTNGHSELRPHKDSLGTMDFKFLPQAPEVQALLDVCQSIVATQNLQPHKKYELIEAMNHFRYAGGRSLLSVQDFPGLSLRDFSLEERQMALALMLKDPRVTPEAAVRKIVETREKLDSEDYADTLPGELA